jgi:hypothetical protein
MATKTFCDRCDTQGDVRHIQVVDYPMPAVYAIPWEGDLCELCIADAIKFLQMLPVKRP